MRRTVYLLALILTLNLASGARGQPTELDPARVTHKQVLARGTAAQVAYYRTILKEFVAAKTAAGGREDL
jgi:hypothetical protein